MPAWPNELYIVRLVGSLDCPDSTGCQERSVNGRINGLPLVWSFDKAAARCRLVSRYRRRASMRNGRAWAAIEKRKPQIARLGGGEIGMNEITTSVGQPTPEFQLPESAPKVRVTAGAGSVAQKTWNLRRPVTLIGSRRPAHIVLHDKNVSRAHCVIVNTGTEVLVKDLHTSKGTRCNDERVDLAVLKDGDVITVGANRIQVAIQVPGDASEDSGCGMAFVDPTRLPTPITLHLIHTTQEWILQDAVTLIGRHDAAPVRLDHDKVSRRHAIVFRFASGSAIFEIGGEGEVAVNGETRSLSRMSDGDRIAIGPFGLGVGNNLSTQPLTPETSQEKALEGRMESDPHQESDRHPTAPDSAELFSLVDLPDSAQNLKGIESQLETISKDIGESWGHLNLRESQLLQNASELNKQEKGLAVRTEELDAKDAAVRGQLHDVTRYQEELQARERELAAQLRRFQEQKDMLAAAQAGCAKQTAEAERRTKELARREHVLAHRWSRLYAAKCPHCDKPLSKPEGGLPPQPPAPARAT